MSDQTDWRTPESLHGDTPERRRAVAQMQAAKLLREHSQTCPMCKGHEGDCAEHERIKLSWIGVE